jgi:hypothetical protein
MMHNGTEYPTFKEAALAQGLLHNDTEYEACMQEAALSAMPNQIRRLFVRLLTFDDLADIEGYFICNLMLWQRIKDMLLKGRN